MTYRVIVTGERDWVDAEAVDLTLTSILLQRRSYCTRKGIPFDLVIVHGACYPEKLPDGTRPLISADWLAHCWACKHGVPDEPHPADWAKHGAKAGPIRNGAVVGLGGKLTCAFWSGRVKRSGTHDMIVQAASAGIPVRIIPKERR